MKTIGRKLLLAVLLVLLSTAFTACNKEVEFEGTLSVAMLGYKGEVDIYAMENLEDRVMEFSLNAKEKRNLNLLAGNYVLKAYSNPTGPGYFRTGFQILPGRTTTIDCSSQTVNYQ